MYKALSAALALGLGTGRNRFPPDLVSLQRAYSGEWRTEIGPEAVFSATGPQVDADGNPCAHNYIPNSEGVGGAVGVLPTGWRKIDGAGFVITVIGAGNGYTDFSIDGISTGTNGANIYFQQATSIAGVLGNTFAGSVNVEVLSGALPSTAIVVIAERNSAGSALTLSQTSITSSGSQEHIRTFTQATAAYADFYIGTAAPTAGTEIHCTIRISRPQLSKSATKLPYIPTYGSAAFGPSITDKGLWAGGAWTQMLQNSILAGAVSGTPGTAPTNWTQVVTGTSSAIHGVGQSAITVTAGRLCWTQNVNVLANTTYYFSVNVLSGGGLRTDEYVGGFSIPVGTVETFEVNGIVTSKTQWLPAGNHIIVAKYVVGSTAGTINFRYGVGCLTTPVTGSATVSNLQVSANYQYPYAASGPGQTTTVPSAAASTGGNGTNTLNSDKMLEALRGRVDGVELASNPTVFVVNASNYSSYNSTTGECRLVSDGTFVELRIPCAALTRHLIRYTQISATGSIKATGATIGTDLALSGTHEVTTAALAYIQIARSTTGVPCDVRFKLSIQRLLPSVFTAVAAVYVGAGSGELASGDHGVLTFNDSSGLGIKMVGAGSLQIIRGSDGTVGINNGVTAWNRDEIHLKVVQTNAAGTQFRVGNRRYTSAMVPIDTLTWGSWATFDGSMNPLTHLRLALNGTIPLWFRLVSLSKKSLADTEILNQLRFLPRHITPLEMVDSLQMLDTLEMI